MTDADLEQIVKYELRENALTERGIRDARAIANQIALTHGIEGEDNVEKLIGLIKAEAPLLGIEAV